MILGGSILQLPAIQTAKEMGHHVITVDIDENCIGFEYSDENLKLSTLDYKSIKKYVEKNPIDGIMTLATDRPVNIVAKLASDFGLKAISIEAAKNSTNKAKMRMILNKYNVLMPKFHVVTNEEEFLKAVDDINGPTIIKASDNAGKRGVRKLKDNASLTEKLETFKYAIDNSLSKEVLVEELIIGKEYSVETITWKNETSIITVTNKYNSGEPAYVEIGHSQPADITYAQYLDVKNIVNKTILNLGIENTACHVEVMINDKGVYLIEIGPRLGGDNISTTLVKLSSGVDMVKASIQMCLNQKPHVERQFNRGSSIRYLLPIGGIFNGIELLENVSEYMDFHELIILKENGYLMNGLSNSNDRLGYVIFSGDSREDAEKKSLIAKNNVKIVVNKFMQTNGGK